MAASIKRGKKVGTGSFELKEKPQVGVELQERLQVAAKL